MDADLATRRRVLLVTYRRYLEAPTSGDVAYDPSNQKDTNFIDYRRY